MDDIAAKRRARRQKSIKAPSAKKEWRRWKNGNHYKYRAMWLRQMGFATYQDYLRSELWSSIRSRVFALKGNQCSMCSADATQLHHTRYHLCDLRGDSLDWIHPICGVCHERIEHNADGSKASVKESSSAFNGTTLSRRRDDESRHDLLRCEVTKEYLKLFR